jgi:hypothetical protein
VRFFVPGQHEEFWVSVDPAAGAVTGFDRTLPEDAAGASIPGAEARAIAESFLAARGIDPAAGEIKEQSEKDEKARRDHTLVWEHPEAGAGEARVRHEIVVQGDRVGSWSRGVKVPEDWRRDREKTTVATLILDWIYLPLLVVLSGVAVVLFVGRIRSGEVPWRFAVVVGGVAALAGLVRSGVSLDALWARYDTSVPAGGYVIVILVGLFIGAVGLFLGGSLVAALAGSLHAQATTLLSRPARRLYARDALVAGLVALGLVLGLPAVERVMERGLPSGRTIQGVSWPGAVEAAVPFLGALTGAILGAIFMAGLGAIVAGLLESRAFRSPGARLVLAALMVLSLVPSEARTFPQRTVAALSAVITIAALVALVRLFLRSNPLAWVWSAWFALGASGAIRLLEQPDPFLRMNGVVAAVCVLAPGGWLMWEARKGATSR